MSPRAPPEPIPEENALTERGWLRFIACELRKSIEVQEAILQELQAEFNPPLVKGLIFLGVPVQQPTQGE